MDYVERIEEICHNKGIRLIYDAAHSMSTEYKGRPMGHYGDAAIFSIAVTKPLACGEGGIVTTDSDNIFRLIDRGRLHGNVVGDLNCVQKGMNAKISEITSILALRGMEKLNSLRDARERVAETYIKELGNLPLRFQNINPDCVTSRKDFGIWVKDEKTRDALKSFLELSGIGVKTYFYPPVHKYTNFSGIIYKVDMSQKLSGTCINLPCYDMLTQEEISYVISRVIEFYK